MKRLYDVIVVGGGPIGSYTAYQLVDKGFDVCILEEKEEIGKDVLCTGIVSKEAFKRYDLPGESILSRIDSFTFVSPSNQKLKYTHPDVFAYIVSREKFDEELSKLAKQCGVEVYLNTRVIEIKESSNSYKLICNGKKYRGKAVVLATGAKYELQSQLGMGKPPGFLYGSQIELPLSIPSSTIEIHLGRNFAPGSFGWIAPLNNGYTRVGVIVRKKGKIWLKRMIKERINFPHMKFYKNGLKIKPIANGAIRHSVMNKILAVGEAAGQVKTSTGGGIFYGLLCSEIAVDSLSKMLKNGSNLNEYDVTWRSALMPELEIGQQLRKFASSLDDKTINNLFSFAKQNRFWVNLLLPRINFDFHSNLLFFCLRSFQSLLGKKASMK